MNKSWALTIAMYLLAGAVIAGEAFFGINLTAENQAFITNLIVLTTGSTTAGGVFNSVMKSKNQFKGTIKAIEEQLKKDGFLTEKQN